MTRCVVLACLVLLAGCAGTAPVPSPTRGADGGAYCPPARETPPVAEEGEFCPPGKISLMPEGRKREEALRGSIEVAELVHPEGVHLGQAYYPGGWVGVVVVVEEGRIAVVQVFQDHASELHLLAERIAQRAIFANTARIAPIPEAPKISGAVLKAIGMALTCPIKAFGPERIVTTTEYWHPDARTGASY